MANRCMLRKELDEPTKCKALAAIEQIWREREIEQQNISAVDNEMTFCTAEKIRLFFFGK